MISQAVQDYLKVIYNLEEKSTVSTTKIAKELNISGASVTGMLKRLAAMKLVDYNSYKGVKLTEKGKTIALEIIRHHRLIELYLKEELGFSLEKVHDEACRLEHYISKEFIEKIDERMGNPAYDPHGHPIPSKQGELPDSDERQLMAFDLDEVVVIRRLSDKDPQMLAYFEKMGLVPNAVLKIIDKAPFNGPLTIIFNDMHQIIGNEIAKNIYAMPHTEN